MNPHTTCGAQDGPHDCGLEPTHTGDHDCIGCHQHWNIRRSHFTPTQIPKHLRCKYTYPRTT